jgi:hypothetical protein
VGGGDEAVESSSDFAAVPDAFQRLWTPHRMVYIQDGTQPHADACPFCLAPAMTDEKALIVARGVHAYVLLNLFPYNSGHVHQHIVPRWATDSNFFPIIAKTKAIPQLLGDVRRMVADGWPHDEN